WPSARYLTLAFCGSLLHEVQKKLKEIASAVGINFLGLVTFLHLLVRRTYLGSMLSKSGKIYCVKLTRRDRAAASPSFIGVIKRTSAPSVRCRDMASATI